MHQYQLRAGCTIADAKAIGRGPMRMLSSIAAVARAMLARRNAGSCSGSVSACTSGM